MIGLILLTALGVRVWGINYDLPYIYHPDEPWPIRIGYYMLVTGDYNPHFFDWPSLIIYVNLLIQTIYYSVEKWQGLGDPVALTRPLIEVAMGVTYSPQPIIVLLGRLVTVAVGVGSVATTIGAGKAFSRNLKVGVLAGIMLALSPTNVSLDRFITPDSYATFFLMVVFLTAIFIVQQGKTWAYMVAGLCLGLAVASKYNAGLIIIVLLAGHFLRTGWRGYKDYRLYLALCLGGLIFVATNPYTLFSFSEFYTGFRSIGKHYSTGHSGMEGDTFKWYLTYMWKTAGILYILAGLEILRGIYSRSIEIILPSIFPVVYFLFITSFVVRNDRTFLPMTPFLFLLAASFLVYLLNKANELQSKGWRYFSSLAIICLFVAGLFLPIAKTTTDTVRLTTVNSRQTAMVWIMKNLPLGAKVAVESYTPFVNPEHYAVQGFERMIEHEPTWYVEQNFDYMVFGQDMFGRFYQQPERYKHETAKYDALFASFQLVKKFTDGGYEVRIYQLP